MRRTGFLLLALLIGTTTTAVAQGGPKDLEKKYQAKLEEAWFKDAGWTDDFATAMRNAGTSGKLIVAYFQRSYTY